MDFNNNKTTHNNVPSVSVLLFLPRFLVRSLADIGGELATGEGKNAVYSPRGPLDPARSRKEAELNAELSDNPARNFMEQANLPGSESREE